jgi:hypothetical protein
MRRSLLNAMRYLCQQRTVRPATPGANGISGNTLCS